MPWKTSEGQLACVASYFDRVYQWPSFDRQAVPSTAGVPLDLGLLKSSPRAELDHMRRERVPQTKTLTALQRGLQREKILQHLEMGPQTRKFLEPAPV